VKFSVILGTAHFVLPQTGAHLPYQMEIGGATFKSSSFSSADDGS
jgi:hypothetical protein